MNSPISKNYSCSPDECQYCHKPIEIAGECITIDARNSFATKYHVGCFAELAMKLSLNENVEGINVDPPEQKNRILKYEKLRANYIKAKEEFDNYSSKINGYYSHGYQYGTQTITVNSTANHITGGNKII